MQYQIQLKSVVKLKITDIIKHIKPTLFKTFFYNIIKKCKKS